MFEFVCLRTPLPQLDMSKYVSDDNYNYSFVLGGFFFQPNLTYWLGGFFFFCFPRT